MDIVHGSKKKRKSKKSLGTVKVIAREEYDGMAVDAKATLIEELIPLGLMAVGEVLQAEVRQLAGSRYQRKDDGQPSRYGTNPGTVRLMGQVLPIQVPRVRTAEGEVSLTSYGRLHRGVDVDEGLFRKVLYGISCRDYESAAETMPGAIGVSSATISRKFVQASAEKLKTFNERRLGDLDVVAILIDGKTFADDAIILAVAVTLSGRKIPVGFIQAETENHKAVGDFFTQLIKRGLDVERGVLFVVDGAKGLRKAIKKVFRNRAVVQRCQWHKRENVVSYLPRQRQVYWRRRLQRAYQLPNYAQAKDALLKIRDELQNENQSAAASLEEGLEETLTLHRLGVFHLVGLSLKTTNCIESIHAMVEQRCGKVDYWKNSSQKQRWYAAALLDIEPRLRLLMGARHLNKLRHALMRDLKLATETEEALAA